MSLNDREQNYCLIFLASFSNLTPLPILPGGTNWSKIDH
jgi:hypothetical protein